MNDDDSLLVEPLPPEPKSRKPNSRILLVVIAVVSTCMLLMCGFCGFAIRNEGAKDGEKVRAAIETDETLLAEIGTIESLDFSFGDSMTAGRGTKVYDVSGTNGSGKLHAEMLGPFLCSVELQKEGKTWDLLLIPPDNPRLNGFILDALQKSPALQKRIGPVQTAKVDWRPTRKLSEEEGDDQLYVIQVSGENGETEILARIELLQDRVIWAKFRDGEQEVIYKSTRRSK